MAHDPSLARPSAASRRCSSRLLGAALFGVAVLIVGACSDSGDDAPAGTEVRPFREVQRGEFVFEADPLDPARGVFRVETTEPMICAIVWGETDGYGRFNNSLSMNGTGIVEHDVLLPDIEPGRRYHFVVQGTTADGTLYRSEPGTFSIEDAGLPPEGAPEVAVGENLALGATVVEVSSEFSASFAGGLAIDGDLATAWSTAGDGDDGSITIDLGAPQRVAAIEFVTRSMADGSAITSRFTVSVDGGEPLGPFPASSPGVGRVVEIDVIGRLLRFEVDESTGGNVGAVEIRVFAPVG
jgi:hypothetical protein